MKRSRSIRLVLLGSTGFLALLGCDQQDPLARNDFFQNEQQCAQSNDASACRQALMDARKEHLRTAPAFASAEACEARFGLDNCQPTAQQPTREQIQSGSGEQPQQTAQSGGSWFLPIMMGYMMGRTMGGPAFGSGAGQQTASADTATGKPVYRDVNNRVYSGSTSLGQTRVVAPPRPAPTVARGGFGSTGTGTVSS
jgi:uncharacterized protein YgiB involved in biofilm formation